MIYGLPRLVPGFRLVPLKIAASGARALLAMTDLVGLAEKRGSFQNEMFENRYEATPRENDRIQQNASVFQTKTFQFCVIARSAATWQSLSDRRGIPWRSTGARNKKKYLSQKRGFAASFRFLSHPSKVLFRPAQP